MNTNRLLIAAAAVTLIAGTGGAFAQQVPAQKPIAPITGRNTNLTFDTSPGDHTRMREIFGKDRSARKVNHVKFSLSAGTVVPGSVRLVALPRTIVESSRHGAGMNISGLDIGLLSWTRSQRKSWESLRYSIRSISEA